MQIIGIIPARYGSTRFPAKALALLKGKSIIQRVYEQVNKTSTINKIIVATDHQKIFDHVKSFGGNVSMTSADHQSGTDRCKEVLKNEKEKFDYVINIQGDEPFIDPAQIDQLANSFKEGIQIGTLIKKIKTEKELFDANVVKVVFNTSYEAIYFSRNPVPFVRSKGKKEWLNSHNFYKHLGIYGYKTSVLNKITSLAVSQLESMESLEQLRWIENGYKIKVVKTDIESIGIDTPEDLKKAEKFLKTK